MKPVVAVDLDDLLYPFMDAMVPFHNKHYGTSLTVDDFHTFEFEQIWGGDRAQALERVGRFFRELEEHPLPMKGASVAIDKLADHFSLVIITARSEEMRDITVEWVDRHFPLRFAGVYLCNLFVVDKPEVRRTKVSVCQEVGARALVDDSLSHVTEAAEAGLLGVLFGNYAWNRTPSLPEGVRRALNWDQVIDLLITEVGA